MSNVIWVVADFEEDGLREVTREILGEARDLGRELKYEVAALLLGHNAGGFADELVHYGAARVYLLEHELLAHYNPEGYTKALVDLIRKFSPRVILFGGTCNGLDLAARTAARLRAGLVTNCVSIRNTGGVLEMTQSIYEDKIYRTRVSQSEEPVIAAYRPGVIGTEKPDRSRRGEVIRLRPELKAAEIRTKVLQSFQEDPETLDLEELEVLVVGGRGVESREKWTVIKDLAEVLGGGVAGTRMALDAGWISRNRLVGQTGKIVSPKLCLEAGVYGAIEHTAGLRGARFIIAINKDRHAPIFKVANVGAVADLHQLIPALIAKIKELRGKLASGPR